MRPCPAHWEVTKMTYEERYDSYRKQAQHALERTAFEVFHKDRDSRVAQAARYSLLDGGKRVRAVLCLAVCEMLCGDMELAARYAAAVEMLHCYSLIHDDLPCMDNDDFRRGKPSCHKAYGEATALLAGDALLTAAFEVLSTGNGAHANQNALACSVLARAAGARGMIYGQELDLHYETAAATEKQLREVHRNKTGMLIAAAAQLGAVAANAFDSDRQSVEKFAFDIGLVFQMVDDVLDVSATTQELGKPAHSDEESGKTTFVTLFGVDETMRMADELTMQAVRQISEKFGEKSDFLQAFARSLVRRGN